MKTKNCFNCNKTIPAESRFCMFCGEETPVEEIKKIHKILDKLFYEKPTKKLLFDLSNEIHRNWDYIKRSNLLTHYLINVMRETKNPSDPKYLIQRIGGDSRTGGVFEDAFSQLLLCYLQADVRLWKENKFRLDIRINDSIPIPNEPRKKKPDILIRDTRSNKDVLVIELKASYSKRSLIKNYKEEENLYQRLSRDLKYYFIIFSASKLKSNTYKNTVDNCRVICINFKTDKESQIKRIQPNIIDPVESILEEIKENLLTPN